MLVSLNNIRYGYHQDAVIDEVNLSILPGDFIGMIGPNGGGKSTIIKIILGLIEPWSGQVKHGVNQEGAPIIIGYLPQFQQFDKSFPITTKEVIFSGLIGGQKGFMRFNKEQKRKTQSLIDLLGLSNLENQSIGELSGGQMQRVFVGRALISDPDVLILDEPATYVDNRFETELYEILQEINKRTAILLVSHDVGCLLC